VRDWMKTSWINKCKDVNYVEVGRWNTTNVGLVNNED